MWPTGPPVFYRYKCHWNAPPTPGTEQREGHVERNKNTGQVIRNNVGDTSLSRRVLDSTALRYAEGALAVSASAVVNARKEIGKGFAGYEYLRSKAEWKRFTEDWEKSFVVNALGDDLDPEDGAASGSSSSSSQPRLGRWDRMRRLSQLWIWYRWYKSLQRSFDTAWTAQRDNLSMTLTQKMKDDLHLSVGYANAAYTLRTPNPKHTTIGIRAALSLELQVELPEHAKSMRMLEDAETGKVVAKLQAAPHQPAYFVAADDIRKAIFVVVRGTRTISDAITDLDFRKTYIPIAAFDEVDRFDELIRKRVEAVTEKLQTISGRDHEAKERGQMPKCREDEVTALLAAKQEAHVAQNDEKAQKQEHIKSDNGVTVTEEVDKDGLAFVEREVEKELGLVLGGNYSVLGKNTTSSEAELQEQQQRLLDAACVAAHLAKSREMPLGWRRPSYAAVGTYEAGETVSVHYGMMKAAEYVTEKTLAAVREERLKNPDYDVVITGHSLGAGTSTLMWRMWHGQNLLGLRTPTTSPTSSETESSTASGDYEEDDLPSPSLFGFVHAVPAVLSADLNFDHLFFFATVNADDWVPRFSPPDQLAAQVSAALSLIATKRKQGVAFSRLGLDFYDDVMLTQRSKYGPDEWMVPGKHAVGVDLGADLDHIGCRSGANRVPEGSTWETDTERASPRDRNPFRTIDHTIGIGRKRLLPPTV
eukprot:g328.t1